PWRWFDESMLDCCEPLEKTGSGHFSPIGAYHAARDLALILDTARFKYHPHWVPVTLLWEAMNTIDEATGHHRGFMLISRRLRTPSLLYTLSCENGSWNDTTKVHQVGRRSAETRRCGFKFKRRRIRKTCNKGKSLVSIDNLPRLLQDEVLNLRGQLHSLKICQDKEGEHDDLGVPSLCP
ncbi:hypothetical protein MKW98_031554, partial [Papaver atlanticum]